MPVSPTYPGVYVQEVPSGVRTIVGVGTSIGMFIGTAKKGPMFKPLRCVNYSMFSTRFGNAPSGGALAQYVKLFFLNGGTDCYVMRLANGATAATVTLRDEANLNDVLQLTAKDLGAAGENIRAIVTYSGAQPEVTFNLELFRWTPDASGKLIKAEREVWSGLSMDPTSPAYAENFLTQNSKLVDATDPNLVAPGLGFSLSGRAVPDLAGATGFQDAWQPLLGNFAGTTTNLFRISVGGSPYVSVNLSGIAVTNAPAALATDIQNAIQAALGFPGVTVTLTPNAGAGRRLRIEGTAANPDVFIRPAAPQGLLRDLTVPLMLGTEQGGLEVSGFAGRRPAPNGITLRGTEANLLALANKTQNQLGSVDLELEQLAGGLTSHVLETIFLQPGVAPGLVVTTAIGDFVAQDAFTNSPNGNSDGVREKLAIIARLINDHQPVPPAGTQQFWRWRAEVWGYRLAILPTDAVADNFISVLFNFTAAGPAPAFTENVHLYSVGASGVSNTSVPPAMQRPAPAPASDGLAPLAVDYDTAYEIIDKEVQPDVFNLMVLPPDAGVPVETLYGLASVFCQKRRAFLLMDPPTDPARAWTDAQTATTGIAGLRTGVSKSYAAVFFPRILVDEGGLKKAIGPAGAVAGLFARTDSTRGVWKAPAGTEADLRGVVGLEQLLSDGENGMLNPRAINTLRVFPNGIVNWGARTMDGDDDFASEYKYIPVRRLALFMEESLYRGLKWVVFEPNDEPLWSQIRLNVGAFMHNLFRQGAFQGRTPRDAYFVKCDSETTTQNDINLGIVNIWVGFAPLKPAEFVILYLQQMAGQIQT